LRSAAEEARREAASLLKRLDNSEAAREKAERARNEAERQRDDAVADASRYQNIAEDAEARCAAAERAAEKSASAAAEAISKARYAAKDVEHSRNELAAVASVAAARDELERALAEKTAELKEAGRLAAEVDRLRREVEATKSEASTAMKTELADAKRALDRKDAELASMREGHASRLREAEEQLAESAKSLATAKADAIYARAEAQAAQQRPSPGALQRAEGRCEQLQRDLEVAQSDWAAERDRLRDARDAQRDRYEELKHRIDEGDEASALALEHAERRADAVTAELEDREAQLAEAREALNRMSAEAGASTAKDEQHAAALEDVSRQLVVAREKLREAESRADLAAQSSDISTSTTALAAPLDDIYKKVRKHERRWQAERARADAATEQLEKLRTAHGDLQVRFDAARRRNRSPPAIAFSPDKALEPPSPVISPSRRPLKPHAPAASRMF